MQGNPPKPMLAPMCRIRGSQVKRRFTTLAGAHTASIPRAASGRTSPDTPTPGDAYATCGSANRTASGQAAGAAIHLGPR